MSDDGSLSIADENNSYYSDDDEIFEPLSIPKKTPVINQVKKQIKNMNGFEEDLEIENEEDLENEEEEEYENSDDEEEYEEDDDEEDEDEQYRKITPQLKENLLEKHYPERKYQNYKEVEILAKVVRDKDGNILDENHKTIPILTKYERTRVLGERTRQIQQGSPLFIENPENIIDSYVLAEMELQQKKIPFIIQRPLPYGSTIEYWRLADLEIL